MSINWRDHSARIAKGEKCPDTVETLQAAWARDQELILDQKSEISRLKQKINQLQQKRLKPSCVDKPEAVGLAAQVLKAQRQIASWPPILRGGLVIAETSDWLSPDAIAAVNRKIHPEVKSVYEAFESARKTGTPDSDPEQSG